MGGTTPHRMVAVVMVMVLLLRALCLVAAMLECCLVCVHCFAVATLRVRCAVFNRRHFHTPSYTVLSVSNTTIAVSRTPPPCSNPPRLVTFSPSHQPPPPPRGRVTILSPAEHPVEEEKCCQPPLRRGRRGHGGSRDPPGPGRCDGTAGLGAPQGRGWVCREVVQGVVFVFVLGRGRGAAGPSRQLLVAPRGPRRRGGSAAALSG